MRREWLGYYYWMENDLVLKVLGKLQYPWLYRHDRRLYEKHPEVDPLNLMRQIFLSSLLGFWVGKAFKKREFLFAAIFTLPSIAIFLNN